MADRDIVIAGFRFDHHGYDERGDVLYLSVGPPQEAAQTIATPEGHAVEYDESGAVIGMVLVNVRFFLEGDGARVQALVQRIPVGSTTGGREGPAGARGHGEQGPG